MYFCFSSHLSPLFLIFLSPSSSSSSLSLYPTHSPSFLPYFRSTVKSYTIEYERPVVIGGPNDGDSPFESLPPRTLTSSNSIFDSDTLPASVARTTSQTGRRGIQESTN